MWYTDNLEEAQSLTTDEQRVEFCKRHNIKVSSFERYLRKVAKKEKQPASIVKFLTKGHTMAEIEAKGYGEADLKIEGYELYETRNNWNEQIYLLLPEIEKVPIQSKIWTYKWAKDQPYLMVQMPKRNWDKIKVVPIADVHYGSTASMVEKFREYVNWIASEPNIFCFIAGDLLENSHGDSNKGISHYEQDVRPKSQVEEMIEILSPIAHKILWAVPGNHEDRSRTRDYDPLERICEKLEIPYSYEPVFADILWQGYVFTFYCQHGRSGSMTNGGKINAAAKPQEMQDYVMFTIMAHVHDGKVDRSSRIVRDRVNFRLEFKKQYIIICPSFFGYFKSYASKAGYKPGSYGSINCDLFRNGDYHGNV